MWWLFTARTAAFNPFSFSFSFFFFLRSTLNQHWLKRQTTPCLLSRRSCVSYTKTDLAVDVFFFCFVERRLTPDLKSCDASDQMNLMRCVGTHTWANTHSGRLGDNHMRLRPAPEAEPCSAAEASDLGSEDRRDRVDSDSDDDGDCGNNDYADYYGAATAMWWLRRKEEIEEDKGRHWQNWWWGWWWWLESLGFFLLAFGDQLWAFCSLCWSCFNWQDSSVGS